MKLFNPPAPGEVLKELYLEPLDLTVTQVAKNLGVSRNALSSVINGKSEISPEMAIKLGLLFDTTPEIWMNLQMQFTLWTIQNTHSLMTKFNKMPVLRSKLDTHNRLRNFNVRAKLDKMTI